MLIVLIGRCAGLLVLLRIRDDALADTGGQFWVEEAEARA
jgi:hypothetical protein